MRLICPSCDAQYEVDLTLIPDEGRDVQCSACGHVWFQSPDLPDDFADAAEALPPATPEPAPAAEPDPQVLRRHSLDDTMMSVLREEAERETRARAAEVTRTAARGLEFQPDLGLPEAGPAPQLRIRPRNPAPEPVDTVDDTPEPPATAARPARRELLPDIEQINSTLDASSATRSGSDGLGVPQPVAARRRSGFRSGFLLMLVLAGLATAAYVQAPRLAQSLPQAAPTLTAYVAMVDRGRLALDGMVQRLLGAPQG